MSNSIRLSHKSGKIGAEINLPSSKSESNRALIINALTGGECRLQNLSTAHDTALMQQLLASTASILNAEDAGTVMRFLTAYYAITNQQKTLTGTARMQDRPIGLLVEALRELGADISYVEKEGYPPLQINGIDLSWPAQEITVPGNISSQFISALVLVAPYLPYGLKIRITESVFSRPYIEMTLQIMRHFDAIATWKDDLIIVEPVHYKPEEFIVEADWSAAGYWYSVAAMAKNATITLPNLRKNSLQADRVIGDLLKNRGVETVFTDNGILIEKKSDAITSDFLDFDFSSCPDLAQTILVLSAATGVKMRLTGLESLKIKETDRVLALQTELKRIGAELIEKDPHNWELQPTQKLPEHVKINTYSDHRMAMAFAPLALLMQVEIENPEVVGKSYPEFWSDLEKADFVIEEL